MFAAFKSVGLFCHQTHSRPVVLNLVLIKPLPQASWTTKYSCYLFPHSALNSYSAETTALHITYWTGICASMHSRVQSGIFGLGKDIVEYFIKGIFLYFESFFLISSYARERWNFVFFKYFVLSTEYEVWVFPSAGAPPRPSSSLTGDAKL